MKPCENGNLKARRKQECSIKLNFVKTCYGDMKWDERSYGRVQGRAFVFAVFDVWLLLLDNELLRLLVCSVVS
jgi:hypothetical protein